MFHYGCSLRTFYNTLEALGKYLTRLYFFGFAPAVSLKLGRLLPATPIPWPITAEQAYSSSNNEPEAGRKAA
jgi:hypothetical protein